jgi:hypothetical protein
MGTESVSFMCPEPLGHPSLNHQLRSLTFNLPERLYGKALGQHGGRMSMDSSLACQGTWDMSKIDLDPQTSPFPG